MKILHVIADLSPNSGGPPKAALEMCQNLGRIGHDVSLYTTDHKQKDDINVVYGRPVIMNSVKVRYFRAFQIHQWPISFALAKAIRKTVKDFDIVEIHSLYLFHSMVAAHFCRKFNIPYIVMPHGSLDPYLRKKGWLKKALFHFLIEDRNLNRAAAIHYTAEEEKELVHSALDIQSRPIVVPLGVNLEDYKLLPKRGVFRQKYPDLIGKPIILFLGRVTQKKGFDLLAEAFGKVVVTHSDVRLVIAGPEDEGFGEQVRQWLDKNGVLDKTIFTGMLQGEDKMAAFADADMFVLPSYSENFGIALVEAMACGLPVITSNKVNIWREVEQTGAGIVINCDADELATAIEDLLKDKCARKKYGENGRKRVEQKYHWNKVAVQLSNEYQNILNCDSD